MYQNTAASRTPDQGATAPRSPFSLSSVPSLFFLTPPPPPEKIPGYATDGGWDSIDGIGTCTGWMVRESNPSGGRHFPCRPEWFRGPFSLLVKMYCVLPGLKVDAVHLPPSTAAVVSGCEWAGATSPPAIYAC
jgi:hypothetical protein